MGFTGRMAINVRDTASCPKRKEGSDPNQTGRNIHLLKIKAIYSKVGSIEDPFTKINSARLLPSRLLQSHSRCRVTSLESKYEIKRKNI